MQNIDIICLIICQLKIFLVCLCNSKELVTSIFFLKKLIVFLYYSGCIVWSTFRFQLIHLSKQLTKQTKTRYKISTLCITGISWKVTYREAVPQKLYNAQLGNISKYSANFSLICWIVFKGITIDFRSLSLAV